MSGGRVQAIRGDRRQDPTPPAVSAEDFRSLLEQAADGFFVLDRAHRLIEVDERLCEILGRPRTELLGRHPVRFAAATWRRLMHAQHAAPTAPRSYRFEARRGDGRTVTLLVRAITRRDSAGSSAGAIGFVTDLSEMVAAQARFEFLAHHDALTELPNRRLFRDRVEQAIERARRSGGQLALLFIDLDRFKAINDSLGHPAGDRVLLEVARRLQKGVRAGDTVSRHGGDEFLVALASIASAADAEVVAAGLARGLAEPIEIDGRVLRIGCTIGMATYPAQGNDCEALLRQADAAMYAARASTRTRIEGKANRVQALAA